MYRFAPSPTGDMHIGNLRAALINFVCAKKSGKKFILRIEDTDTQRNIGGKENDICELLTLFKISWDEFYVQSHNFALHQKLADKLLSSGAAFKCYCTQEELAREKEAAKENKIAYRYSGKCEHLSESEIAAKKDAEFVIRVKKPEQNITFTDAIKGELTFAPNDIDSFVIMRSSGIPTYNFACAMDDMCEGVSFIIRGEDHVSNTPKQEHLRASLGYTEPMQYAHLPIILDGGKKMSKRCAHSSVKWLLENGFLPDAISNYLLLLGNKTPCEIFELENAFEWFDLANLSHSPANFDIDKLRFINREHIKKMDDDLLVKLLFKDEFLANFSDASPLAKLAKLYTEEASTLNEIRAKLASFFLPMEIAFKEFGEFYESAKLLFSELQKPNLSASYDEFKQNHSCGLKGKMLFASLRILLSGARNGPDLGAIYEICVPIMPALLQYKKGVNASI